MVKPRITIRSMQLLLIVVIFLSQMNSITYVNLESLKLRLKRLCVKPVKAVEAKPEEFAGHPLWMSPNALIHSQELRQWEWEVRARGEKDPVVAASTRLNFAKTILDAAMKSEEKLAHLAVELMRNSTILRPKRGSKATVFNDIMVSVELGPEWVEAGDGKGQDRKAIVGTKLLRELGRDCVIYGAGIDYNDEFGTAMATRFGCSVHSFDCTMLNDTKLEAYLKNQNTIENLAFHPWCFANKTILPSTVHVANYQLSEAKMGSFHSLDRITQLLGHDEVDVMKFDIEGYEWNLLETIMNSRRLPRQLAFELHTRFSNPKFVPAPLVANKGRREVVLLFLQLHELGYRVVSKELNNGDRGCAEFVLYRFDFPGT